MAALDASNRETDVLVVIFLRGGADGLNMIVPYREDAYYRLRPSLSISEPTDLDGFFGFHPKLGPLLPLFRDGRLGAVHAVGSGDQTRSHFEAMSAMERGLADDQGSRSDGWLARALTALPSGNGSPMRAIAIASTMPDSLRGALGAVSLESIDDYRLRDLAGLNSEEAVSALREEYSGKDPVSEAGRDTLDVLKAIQGLNPATYRADRGAAYPETDLGRGLRQIAMLVRADVGLQVACLDRGGWDTHVAQGSTEGLLAGNLDDLARSIAAFDRDLGGEMTRVTVVVMTEFGRRAYENTGLGTDHGRGSVMLALGAGVNGGRVHGTWPGLAEDQLEGPGDLRVTTDYRNVLAEALGLLGSSDLAAVFPDFTPAPVGLLE
jgi:uncharacterized protein (DUF1501 family)